MPSDVTLADILLGQWLESPRLLGIVRDVLQPILDSAVDAVDDIEDQLDVENAEGVWLDRLGLRLGIRRPATTDPARDERFGYAGAGEPFDTEPFRGSTSNDAVYPLPDAIYRRFVKARGIAVLSIGAFDDFVRTLAEVEPNATAVDNRDMTISVTTALRPLVQQADETRVLAVPGGVQVVYA